MGAIASQITNLTSVYSIVYLDANQRKHQSSASPAFVPVNSPHKWPVTRKMFPFDGVILGCHHANFVVTGGTGDDKIAIITTHVFQGMISHKISSHACKVREFAIGELVRHLSYRTMAWCETVVVRLLMHCSHPSLALSHRYVVCIPSCFDVHGKSTFMGIN